jgi:hypothetical protein
VSFFHAEERNTLRLMVIIYFFSAISAPQRAIFLPRRGAEYAEIDGQYISSLLSLHLSL